MVLNKNGLPELKIDDTVFAFKPLIRSKLFRVYADGSYNDYRFIDREQPNVIIGRLWCGSTYIDKYLDLVNTAKVNEFFEKFADKVPTISEKKLIDAA